MGHAQSKRKKDKKRKKGLSCIMKGVTGGDSDNIHQVAGHRIYRDSSNMDQLSSSSGYFSSESSPPSSGNDVNWAGNEVTLSEIEDSLFKRMAAEDPDSAVVSPFLYQKVNIDEHPALSKLQNEQNARLESMEQRMAQIKTNAMHAYERKKFAHMFRAKKDDGRTEQLLQEARDMLQRNLEDQNDRKDCTLNNNDYAGEIIPVRIVKEESKKRVDDDRDSYLQLTSFNSLNLSLKTDLYRRMRFITRYSYWFKLLGIVIHGASIGTREKGSGLVDQLQEMISRLKLAGDPVMFFLLPFILPLFIIVAVIRGLSETFGWHKQGTFKAKRRNS